MSNLLSFLLLNLLQSISLDTNHLGIVLLVVVAAFFTTLVTTAATLVTLSIRNWTNQNFVRKDATEAILLEHARMDLQISHQHRQDPGAYPSTAGK